MKDVFIAAYLMSVFSVFLAVLALVSVAISVISRKAIAREMEILKGEMLIYKEMCIFEFEEGKNR